MNSFAENIEKENDLPNYPAEGSDYIDADGLGWNVDHVEDGVIKMELLESQTEFFSLREFNDKFTEV